jgi:hypothetical protein
MYMTVSMGGPPWSAQQRLKGSSTVMRVRASLILAALAVSASAYATPIGVSWDGSPPGNITQITSVGGLDWHLGGTEFDPGTWTVTYNVGYTAFTATDQIGVADGAGWALYFDRLPTIFTWTYTTPWRLVGSSPAIPGVLDSTGIQFVFAKNGPDAYLWGFEDLPYGLGDDDFQDAYGTIVRQTGGGSSPPPPVPTPEPTTVILVLAGGIRLLSRKRHA